MSELILPYLYDGYGTGALYKSPDPRNKLMVASRAHRVILASALPPNFLELEQHVVYTYNQGSTPACVFHSECGVQTGNEHIERHGEVVVFDAMAAHAATGPMNQGRYPETANSYAQHTGLPVQGSTKRYRIGSYAYARKSSPQDWVDDVKAALVGGHLLCICSLLWSQFGVQTGGSQLGVESYHQFMGAGYRTGDGTPLGSVRVKNSWGQGWAENGFGWVPFHLLVAESNWPYLIASLITDGMDDDITPPPKPPEPLPNPLPPDPNDFAAQILKLQNDARGAAGLKPLALHPALVKSAQDFALWEGQHNQYGHEADGRKPIERMIAAGLPANGWSNWGENIAAGESEPGTGRHLMGGRNAIMRTSAMRDGSVLSENALWQKGDPSTPGGAFTDWMNSPGHKANILFPAFTHCGIGVAEVPGSAYRWYWVVDFVALSGTPPPDPKPPDPKPPTPTPTQLMIVTGNATGPGASSITVGHTLSIANVDARLEVTSVIRREVPPDPNPPDPNPPDPNPPDPKPPTPGGLQVAVDLVGNMLAAWATLNGVPQRCRFSGSVGDMPLPDVQSTSMMPFRGLWFRVDPRGKTVNIHASTLDGQAEGDVSRQF